MSASSLPESELREEPAIEPAAEPRTWSAAKRILFRFAFAYFVLFNLPFPLNLVPGLESEAGVLATMWQVTVEMAGELLGVNAVPMSNGSGDTTFHWVHLLCVLAAALVVAIVWSILDRPRARYDRAYALFRMHLRFALAFSMMGYGFAKIFPQQFPPLTLDRLLQPYGDSSPMGLLWTLMSASRPYSIFGGAGEVLGGLLLTTRRTTLLGALITAAVMANIVMLNFAYDVPVKIYSTHLLAMAVVLALPDARRLLSFFVMHRPIAPAPLPRLTSSRWALIAGIVARTLIVAALVVLDVQATRNVARRFDAAASRSPIHGIWSVKAASRGAAVQWSRVVFENKTVMGVLLDGNSRRRVFIMYDEAAKSFQLTKRNQPQWQGKLAYAIADGSTLALDGVADGKPLHVVARREAIPKFLLTSRGFHWINEYPFNR